MTLLSRLWRFYCLMFYTSYRWSERVNGPHSFHFVHAILYLSTIMLLWFGVAFLSYVVLVRPEINFIGDGYGRVIAAVFTCSFPFLTNLAILKHKSRHKRVLEEFRNRTQEQEKRDERMAAGFVGGTLAFFALAWLAMLTTV